MSKPGLRRNLQFCIIPIIIKVKCFISCFNRMKRKENLFEILQFWVFSTFIFISSVKTSFSQNKPGFAMHSQMLWFHSNRDLTTIAPDQWRTACILSNCMVTADTTCSINSQWHIYYAVIHEGGFFLFFFFFKQTFLVAIFKLKTHKSVTVYSVHPDISANWFHHWHAL